MQLTLMHHLTEWLNEEALQLDASHLRRPRRTIRILPDAWCEFEDRRLRNFASNDYLNFAHDPKLVKAASETVSKYGVGSTASSLVCGRSQWHEKLEQRISQFEEQPAALLFPSGYAANLGTISALVSRDDVLFCDQLNHACLIDGSRLTKAKRIIYKSQDINDLKTQLETTACNGRRWIVTDAVFSMDGRLAALNEICELADQYEATVIVDEAHGTGVFGPNGRGVAELMQVEDRNVVRTGTLSKAIGCHGGFVSGSPQLIDFLWHRARPQFFSTALPPAVCAAAVAAFDLIRDEPQRRERVMKTSNHLRNRLQETVQACSNLNAEIVPGSGPIVPLILHQPDAATRMADELRERGFLTAAIRPPTVPAGTSRLRISVSSAHTLDDIHRLVDTLADCFDGAVG